MPLWQSSNGAAAAFWVEAQRCNPALSLFALLRSGRVRGLSDFTNNTNDIDLMNNGTIETSQTASPARFAPATRPTTSDELSQVKRELLQAEVRLAKARATAAGAEVDIKVLGARLRSLAK